MCSQILTNLWYIKKRIKMYMENIYRYHDCITKPYVHIHTYLCIVHTYTCMWIRYACFINFYSDTACFVPQDEYDNADNDRTMIGRRSNHFGFFSYWYSTAEFLLVPSFFFFFVFSFMYFAISSILWVLVRHCHRQNPCERVVCC